MDSSESSSPRSSQTSTTQAYKELPRTENKNKNKCTAHYTNKNAKY